MEIHLDNTLYQLLEWRLTDKINRFHSTYPALKRSYLSYPHLETIIMNRIYLIQWVSPQLWPKIV